MELTEDSRELLKRIGITNQIRSKLNFLDERLWKRFSARRLEIIDTLDLSLKKASEQEIEIKKVAELLRVEFNYSEEYSPEFDKLVRAAIQSVRRNRKRLLRSRKGAKPLDLDGISQGTVHEIDHYNHSQKHSQNHRNNHQNHDIYEKEDEELHKKPKIDTYAYATGSGIEGGTVSPASELVHKTHTMLLETDVEDQARKNRFVLEILRLNSDSQEDGEKRYLTTRQFLALDKSRAAIGLMIEPRMASSLPPVLRDVGQSSVVSSIPLVPLASAFVGVHPGVSSGPLNGGAAAGFVGSRLGHGTNGNSNDSSNGMSNSMSVDSSDSASGISKYTIGGGAHGLGVSGSRNGNSGPLLNHSSRPFISPVPTVTPPHIPSFSLLHMKNGSHHGKMQLLHYFERLRSSEEAQANDLSSICILGKGVITTCLAFVFEKSFERVLSSSLEYIRSKLSLDAALARIFRDLDPNATDHIQLNDESALMTFSTLVGSCVKDFGFDTIISPLGEIFYWTILSDYPLIAKNAVEFKPNFKSKSSYDVLPFEPPQESLLESLAQVATMQAGRAQRVGAGPGANKKKVVLKFLNSKLEFLYPESNSATPKLRELIENGKSAFKLELADSNVSIKIRDSHTGNNIELDSDLETIFKRNENIELDMYIRRAKEIPTHQITLTVFPTIRPTSNGEPKILLPPPVRLAGTILPINNAIPNPIAPSLSGFKFLLNFEDSPPPPPPIIPKFQPLL